jgi:hypothetical protein
MAKIKNSHVEQAPARRRLEAVLDMLPDDDQLHDELRSVLEQMLVDRFERSSTGPISRAA